MSQYVKEGEKEKRSTDPFVMDHVTIQETSKGRGGRGSFKWTEKERIAHQGRQYVGFSEISRYIQKNGRYLVERPAGSGQLENTLLRIERQLRHIWDSSGENLKRIF